MTIKKLANYFLESFFPTRCVACRHSGYWWCIQCRGKVEKVRRDICPRCCSAKAEHECKGGLKNLDALVATGFYHDPRLRAVLQALKYKGATSVLPSIGSYLASWREERVGPWPWAGLSEMAIQFLPASPPRERERGFDQSEMIAGLVSETFVPWAERIDCLERSSQRTSQVSLQEPGLRRANVSGAFSLKAGVRAPRNVLLVDDVVTTGSTMDEAAGVLRGAGAEKIFGFALAVGT